jgi:hypothetical protein
MRAINAASRAAAESPEAGFALCAGAVKSNFTVKRSATKFYTYQVSDSPAGQKLQLSLCSDRDNEEFRGAIGDRLIAPLSAAALIRL